MYTQNVSPERTNFDLRDALTVLRRRKWTIIVVVVVVLALGAVMSYRKSPVYEARASLLLRAASSSSVLAEQASSDPERRVQNEAELLQGARTAREVQQRLGFGAGVGVAAGGDSDVIEITASSGDPERAALVANTYAETHRDLRQQDNLSAIDGAKREVQLQLDEIESALAENAQQLTELNDQRFAATDPFVVADIDKQITANQQAREALLRNRQPYTDQLGQLEIEADLARENAPLEILAPASAPGSPVSPDHRQDLTVTLVLGLLLGIAVAFVQEHLDDSVRNVNDLAKVTGGLPSLAIIPRHESTPEGQAPPILTATKPMSHTAESYRSLRTSVEFLALEKRMQTIQVTSAQAGEGKTSTVVNLAVAFAQAGEHVIVIDCDLRRPRLHEYFGLDRHLGFTSVLLNERSLEEVVRSAPGLDNLQVLCSGPLAPNPSELLGGERFAEIIRKLSTDHTVVLIDSPPVLPVTDALVLSRVADATIVVAASGVSSKRRFARSVDSLRQVGAPLVGSVLNAAPLDVAYGYVDYGYVAYGSGSGSDSGRWWQGGRRRQRERA
ncbi:MAG: polysaccharide biosynthesis tyrosine autokinase [Acidimicrobiales bacterium]|nr:polysaccharide biosynthesis tyrosine autokinase [Acidimicrobiales bacterium]MCB1014222.1 polysaccharide biosynthesis tyrosine autokinase [Acidimicrobiales bacterium]